MKHIQAKVASGATRNLVVRGGAVRLSEDDVRDHLEHIHNLAVLDVTFQNGDVYISTNSIHNALNARTCMLSRSQYRGLKIEWYADECAAPLPAPGQSMYASEGVCANSFSRPVPPTRQPSNKNHAMPFSRGVPLAKKAAGTTVSNSYSALSNLREAEDSSDEDEEPTLLTEYDDAATELSAAS